MAAGVHHLEYVDICMSHLIESSSLVHGLSHILHKTADRTVTYIEGRRFCRTWRWHTPLTSQVMRLIIALSCRRASSAFDVSAGWFHIDQKCQLQQWRTRSPWHLQYRRPRNLHLNLLVHSILRCQQLAGRSGMCMMHKFAVHACICPRQVLASAT